MRSKLFDSPLKTRTDIRFISKRWFNKCINSNKWQILEIKWNFLSKQNHLLFATLLTRLNFKRDYQTVLDKKKHIVIYGDWHKLTPYYRFLDYMNYKVYLIK